jgi:hypothetical protein
MQYSACFATVKSLVQIPVSLNEKQKQKPHEHQYIEGRVRFEYWLLT